MSNRPNMSRALMALGLLVSATVGRGAIVTPSSGTVIYSGANAADADAFVITGQASLAEPTNLAAYMDGLDPVFDGISFASLYRFDGASVSGTGAGAYTLTYDATTDSGYALLTKDDPNLAFKVGNPYLLVVTNSDPTNPDQYLFDLSALGWNTVSDLELSGFDDGALGGIAEFHIMHTGAKKASNKDPSKKGELPEASSLASWSLLIVAGFALCAFRRHRFGEAF